MLRTASFLQSYIYIFLVPERWPPNVWSDTYHCGSAQTYLISRLHEDVIGDFPKGQPQVNDVILSAASFWEIADVHHTASTRLPLCELMGTKSSQWLVFKRHFPLALYSNVPNGYLPPNNDCKTKIYKINAGKESIHKHIGKHWFLYHLFTHKKKSATFLMNNHIQGCLKYEEIGIYCWWEVVYLQSFENIL